MTEPEPPETAEFESGDLPVDVLVVLRPTNGASSAWRVATVLSLAPAEATVVHSPWNQPFV